MSECDDVEEWVELGAALHTPQSELDNIEHSHRDNPARCRRELFKVSPNVLTNYMYKPPMQQLHSCTHVVVCCVH